MAPRKQRTKKRLRAPTVPTQEITEAQQAEIRQAFDMFDTGKSGSIHVNEVKYALRSLGLEVRKNEINSWVAVGDNGPSDSVDSETFCRMASSKLLQKELAIKAFKLFDKDGKGVICLEDLQRVAAELGENMSDEELQELIQETDGSDTGFLDQNDFLRVAVEINL